MLLLTICLAQKSRVILFSHFKQSIKLMDNDQAVNVDDQDDNCDDAVAQVIFLFFGEEINAQSKVQ